MTSSPSLSLVLPVFDAASHVEGALRTSTTWLAARGVPAELVVVDDGSRDATPALLASFAATAGRDVEVRVLRQPENRGKGAAVRRGMLEAKGALRVFVDADLSYPMENVGHVVDALEAGADVAVGSRGLPGSVSHAAPGHRLGLLGRRMLGRVFNLVARATLLRGIVDTQAGIKGLRAAAAEAVFSRARVDRYAFDVEMLVIARHLGLGIVEVPVRLEYGGEKSHLRFGRDGLRMLVDVLRIRRRLKRGVYAPAAPSVGAAPSLAVSPEEDASPVRSA